MVTCFDWKSHEILLNTVYLRKLSDVDAVDVRVLHNVSHCQLRRPLRMYIHISFFLKRVHAICFGQK